MLFGDLWTSLYIGFPFAGFFFSVESVVCTLLRFLSFSLEKLFQLLELKKKQFVSLGEDKWQ